MLIRSGRFAGKRVALAPRDRITRHASLLQDFMRRIFGLEPREYLVTDESRLSDFLPFGRMDAEVRERIAAAYGIDAPARGNATLVEVFDLVSG